MFKYLTIDNFNLNNKTIGVRIDLNLPKIEDKIIKTKQFIKSLKTIKELLKLNTKIVILAHQGRFGHENCSSLKDHKTLLEEELKTQITFIETFEIEKISEELKNLNDENKIILLENIRFLEDEINPPNPEDTEQIKNNFILNLQSLFDYYIIEDFSLLHNNQTSISKIDKIPCLAGRNMERELSHLNKINDLKNPKIFIFGGTKVKKLLEFIKYSLDNKTVDKILLTGILGEIALISRGYSLGKKEKFLKKEGFLLYVDEFKEIFNKYKDKFLFPQDVAIFNGETREEIDVRDFDLNEEKLNKYEISDIGMKTVNLYQQEIENAASIFLKGAVGKFEDEHFEKGFKEIIRIIVNSNTYSFIGGGHSVMAANMFNMVKEFSYVSSAGTALVDFLSEKPLPGLESISKSFKKYYTNQADFIVIGSNTMDIKVDVPEKISQMEMGSKIKIDENFKFNTGGGGVNVSITMSKIGDKIAYLGKISTENKDLLLKTLNENSINLIKSKETKKPCAKSILLQTKDKDRVILTYRGHNSNFSEKDFDIKQLQSNNFYFSSLNDEAFLAQIKLAKQIKQNNQTAKICFNPSSHLIKNDKNIFDMIKLTDVLIFNFDEAKELTQQRYIEECLKETYNLGPKLVVITDGVNGTHAYDGKKIYFQKAKEAKKIVDTTGAGDCFAATFFYFYAKGYGIKSSLIYASTNSANLITKTGTQNGLLGYNELLKKKRI